MTRLILITGFSGASTVSRAGLADVALTLDRPLVWGPPPSAAELTTFFEPLTGQKQGPHWLDYSPAWRVEEGGARDIGLVEVAAKCESVALWINPEPNAQLSLVWLLDYLRSYKELASRLTLVQADLPLGSQSTDELAKSQPLAIKLLDRHLEAASAAWTAWLAPTPKAWFELLGQDLTVLPRLRRTALAMVEELPSRTTGLGATEFRTIELISKGDVSPSDVFSSQHKALGVFDYWEFGELLDGLVRCPIPAVSGLNEGPFTVEMSQDRERSERYEQSKLSLTTLGKVILAGTDDFSRHNPIHRWWGGTELSNDRLWRWDAASKTLIAP